MRVEMMQKSSDRKEMVVSVFMLCFNHERFISRAIDSILAQKVDFEYEIIIGDDCSKDNSAQIIRSYCEKYPDKIFAVIREQNLGSPGNTYDMMNRCCGKYIACLECDDFWTDTSKLQKQIEFLETHPKYSSCGHKTIVVDEFGKEVGLLHPELPGNRGYSKQEVFEQGSKFLHPSSLVYRNFIRGSEGRYDIIAHSNRLGTHYVTILILAGLSDIYVFPDRMSAWRKIVSDSGNNYTSMTVNKSYEVKKNNLEMFYNFRKYFKNEYNFDVAVRTAYADVLHQIRKENFDTPIKQKYLKECKEYLNETDKWFVLIYTVRLIMGKVTKKIKKMIGCS